MSERCQWLPWDSAFFGCRIARLEGDRLRAEEAEAVLAWCARERIDCLYFLANAACPETSATAARHGFACIDLRVTYARPAGAPISASDPRVVVRPHRAADLPALAGLARVAHTDSRFFFDRRFSQEKATLLFETWLRQACAKDHVLVGEVEGRPAGYLLCEDAGRIGLLAVEPARRGQGVGSALLRGALAWFENQDVAEVRVVTQGRNVAAQRLYQHAGFRTQSVECWFHRWFTP